jgi:hypothetical protein
MEISREENACKMPGMKLSITFPFPRDLILQARNN